MANWLGNQDRAIAGQGRTVIALDDAGIMDALLSLKVTSSMVGAGRLEGSAHSSNGP